MLLFGNSKCILDDKNRIRLPAKFREEMGNRYILMPGSNGCLNVFPADSDSTILKALEQAFSFNPDDAEAFRSITECSALVDADSQGRFMLPPDLLEIGAINREVRIIGCVSRAEIWSEERYAKRKSTQDRSPEGIDKIFKHLYTKYNGLDPQGKINI